MRKRKRGLTLKQLQEWESMDRIDPIGKWRDDFGWAVLATVVSNLAIDIHAKKGTKRKEILDFMPDWSGEGEQEKVQSVEQMKQALLALASGQNKVMKRKEVIQTRIAEKKKKENG